MPSLLHVPLMAKVKFMEEDLQSGLPFAFTHMDLDSKGERKCFPLLQAGNLGARTLTLPQVALSEASGQVAADLFIHPPTIAL